MPISQLCLITGGSSGIGKAIARQLLAEGHRVIAVARNTDRMEDLRALGAHTMHMDVSDAQSIASALATIEAMHGSIEVLINNAGFALFGAIEEISLDEARTQFEVNLFGAAHLSQLVLPAMRAKRNGRIINISSMSGRIHAPLSGWYTASKHALEGWSDCLRVELAPFGIDVVIVEPGTIKTGFSDAALPRFSTLAASGPYADVARAMHRVLQTNVERGTGSDPQVVAQVVSTAIKTKRPRTRYAIGFGAKPLLWLRRHISDRAFDRLVNYLCTR